MLFSSSQSESEVPTKQQARKKHRVNWNLMVPISGEVVTKEFHYIGPDYLKDHVFSVVFVWSAQLGIFSMLNVPCIKQLR